MPTFLNSLIRKYQIISNLLLTLLFFASLGIGELEAQVLDSIESNIATVSARIDSFMSKNSIPGLVIAVGQDSELLWHRGFGYADLEKKTPATPDHVFRIASISKPITSAALGILVEGKLMNLDDPIQNYVSYFPKKQHEITPRLIAGHLAGIRHYRGMEFRSNKHFDSVEEAVQVFAADSLISIPGQEYHYSSFGWNLLSAAVEGASSRPFLEFMQDFVFDPLEMTMTGPEIKEQTKGKLASFYNPFGGKAILAPEVDNSIKWAGGGFVSTSSDIVKFGMAMLGNELIKQETFDEFIRPMTEGDGTSTRYGIGWASDEFDGRKFIGHTGGAMGGSSVLFMLPDSDFVLSIICNLRGVNLIEIAREIAFVMSPEQEVR